MPTLSNDELIAAIDNEEIGGISLDTTAFDAASCDLDARTLTGMSQFPPSGIAFLVTDIVKGEVKSHISRDTKEASDQLKSALALSERRWKVDALSDSVKKLFDYDQLPETFADARFEEFEKLTGATNLSASEHADSGKIVADYFSVSAPFEKKAEKKHEFPDAIALGELEGWAAQQGKLVLVVSRDGGWQRRAAVSDHLVCVKSPWDAYRIFNRADAHVARRVVDALIKGDQQDIVDAIDTALERFTENISPGIDASAGYHYDVEFEGLSFERRDEPDPAEAVIIHSDEETVDVAFPLTITLKAQAGFTFMVRDEGEYFPIGHASVERDVEMDVVVTATIDRSGAEGIEVSDVDVEASRYTTIDFGSVEPDWESGPPDDEEWA